MLSGDTISRPFAKPETGRMAVKAIHYGDEVLKVSEVG